MQIPTRAPLFAWAYLEDSPSLQTVRELLGSVPDAELLAELRQQRGHGRNDYPVEVLWGTVVLTVALRHGTIQSCLEELRRNEALRLMIGAASESEVPKPWNVSRFLKSLGEPRALELLQQMFGVMAKRLGEAVPTLGRHCAGDSTGLSARVDKATANGQLPQPDGGRKEYLDQNGNVIDVVEWFGYKLHLLVDTRHEVALAYRVTSTKVGDGEALPELLDQACSRLPETRIDSVAYDLAADSVPVHSDLHQRRIRPIIEVRELWKDNHDRDLPGPAERPVRVTYDEAGTVFCWDDSKHAPVRRRMSYVGHERSRGTLKYRCAALAHDWPCGCERKCNAGKCYGLTVRVKRELDLRRFPPVPRATQTFERLYRGRTAVERVNGRLKLFWGVDDGNITGPSRFHAYVGVVMAVHLGFATVLASTHRPPVALGVTGLAPVREALLRSRPPPKT